MDEVGLRMPGELEGIACNNAAEVGCVPLVSVVADLETSCGAQGIVNVGYRIGYLFPMMAGFSSDYAGLHLPACCY